MIRSLTLPEIKEACPGDGPAIETALKALAQDLGDPYHAGADALHQALFGQTASAWAQIAREPDDEAPRGLALYSPVFSTIRGGAGLYVSDLWVDAGSRGMGLGRALLRHAACHAGGLWGACFLRLAVYPDNLEAQGVYGALGFEPVAHELTMVLTGTAFQNLRGLR